MPDNIAAFRTALEKSDVPSDIDFFVGNDCCLVSYGDWHGKAEYGPAVALAKQHFSKVDDDSECGRPSWATRTLRNVKVASKTFSRPENQDEFKDLSGNSYAFWSGGNDWEDCFTSAWVDVRDRDGTTTRVWLRVKFKKSVDSGRRDKESDDWMAKARTTWVREMKRLKSEEEYPSDSGFATIRYFKEALKTEAMRPFVDECGVDETKWQAKEAGAVAGIPVTGPEAIAHALSRIDPEQMRQHQVSVLKSGKISKRDKAVDVLNALQGLQRNNLHPRDLMINGVPVIPPQFRPFTVIGDAFSPGDANELYRDLFKVRDAYNEAGKVLGPQGQKGARLHLYDAIKAVYGYGDPVEPKTAARGVSGFLQKVTGTSPKFGVVNRNLLSKPQDSVGRGVIGVDADLGMDEIGVPKSIAWQVYAPYIQSRLVRGGWTPGAAVKAIKDKHRDAEFALQRELKERPVIYSRAPAWHKFSVIAGHPKLIEGDTIMVNPYITAGISGDFDGDAINLHVPSMHESVKEAYSKLMPSKMLFSDRDYDKIPAVPKHEAVLGLYAASRRPPKQTHQFADEGSALKAIKSGKVGLSDEVNF